MTIITTRPIGSTWPPVGSVWQHGERTLTYTVVGYDIAAGRVICKIDGAQEIKTATYRWRWDNWVPALMICYTVVYGAEEATASGQSSGAAKGLSKTHCGTRRA